MYEEEGVPRGAFSGNGRVAVFETTFGRNSLVLGSFHGDRGDRSVRGHNTGICMA